MKGYRFDPEKLTFKKKRDWNSFLAVIFFFAMIFVIVVISFWAKTKLEPTQFEKELIVFENDSSDTSFTFDRFKQFVVDAGIKFPDIVIAQAVCESGFKSTIWKENNNPFGMKMAKSRNTTAIETNRNHAKYKNWQMAVIDYAYYQAVFMRKVNSRENYFKALNSYAEDPNYENKLKTIIRKHKGFGLSDEYLNDF
jgi:hypothetical protein